MQFLVPQFIDVEPKIIGPISVRQFILIAVGGALMYGVYSIFALIVAVPLMLLIAGVSFSFAFLKINTQPLHIFMLSFIKTFRKPRLKTWKKLLTPLPVKKAPKDLYEKEAKEMGGPAPRKIADTQNLGELALILDTGGTYRGEEERSLILPKQTAVPKAGPTPPPSAKP